MRIITLDSGMAALSTGTIRGGSYLSLLLALTPERRWRSLTGHPSVPMQ